MNQYRLWLKDNDYDWEDAKLSLGYIKLGQVDLQASFGDTSFMKIYQTMKDDLNISSIQIAGNKSYENKFPYTLESNDWKKIQIEGLKTGYESRSLC